MRFHASFERQAFASLTLTAALLVFVLPVVPGHDIPQHLAYVSRVAAWQRDPGPLAATYSAPDVSNVYATTYRLMAPIARWVGPDACLRLVLAAYVVLLALAVRALVRASWPSAERRVSPVTSLLGPVAAFNPVLCMGFLAYLVALVPLVATVAAVVAYVPGGRRRGVIGVFLLSAATAALHGVAAASLVAFCCALLLFRRDRRSLAALCASAAGFVVTSRVLGSVAHLPEGFGGRLLSSMTEHGVVDGFVGAFRISFASPVLKLDYVIASVLGPFPPRIKIACAAMLTVAALAARLGRRAPPSPAAAVSDPVRGLRPALLVFALFAVLAPAALQVPDDLSLLDFRLVTTATILGIAALPPHAWARARVPTRVFACATFGLLAVWARQLEGIAGELAPAVRLTERLAPGDRLLSLPMHDDSAYLEEANAVLHYDAVFHTARTGGVTSLFWARFSPRLPVGYAPLAEPARPPDWAPWAIEDAQLMTYSHVLVRWPAPDEEERMHGLADRVVRLRERRVLEPIACDEGCCLFAVRPDTRAVRASYGAPVAK
jgi:hypothetical protein